MTQSLAQNAIALLIDLAERGEINPWDVQVIEVIDRFLSELQLLARDKADRMAYEADLSESGQAFLYASMLVLLKADSLARSESTDNDTDPLAGSDLTETEDVVVPQLPLQLDRQLRRRAVAQPPQQRQVTLQELIDQLQLMATAMEAQSPRSRTRQPRPQPRSQAVRAIAQLAHQENLSEVASELDHFLTNQWSQLVQDQDWLDFEHLLEFWFELIQQKQSLQTAPTGHSGDPHVSERVGVFWALLFLSAQSKVELVQEEFYQDLKVRPFSTPIPYALPE